MFVLKLFFSTTFKHKDPIKTVTPSLRALHGQLRKDYLFLMLPRCYSQALRLTSETQGRISKLAILCKAGDRGLVGESFGLYWTNLGVNVFIVTRMGFPGSSAAKESACNAGDPSSIPGLGSSLGEGIGYPHQYSWASLVAQMAKNLPAVRETWI